MTIIPGGFYYFVYVENQSKDITNLFREEYPQAPIEFNNLIMKSNKENLRWITCEKNISSSLE